MNALILPPGDAGGTDPHAQRWREQARETPRRYVERESHQLWGRNHLLTVIEADSSPSVKLDHRRITLSVRPGSDAAKRAEVMYAWHRRRLHAAVPDMIARWEPRLGVKVSGYFLQHMKTKWGSCNHAAGNIRLNTELVKQRRGPAPFSPPQSPTS